MHRSLLMRSPATRDGVHERTVRIPPLGLDGTLALPAGASGVVAFAHGSGSSRRSPRNRRGAEALGAQGLATLLFDLLTEDEP